MKCPACGEETKESVCMPNAYICKKCNEYFYCRDGKILKSAMVTLAICNNKIRCPLIKSSVKPDNFFVAAHGNRFYRLVSGVIAGVGPDIEIEYTDMEDLRKSLIDQVESIIKAAKNQLS